MKKVLLILLMIFLIVGCEQKNYLSLKEDSFKFDTSKNISFNVLDYLNTDKLSEEDKKFIKENSTFIININDKVNAKNLKDFITKNGLESGSYSASIQLKNESVNFKINIKNSSNINEDKSSEEEKNNEISEFENDPIVSNVKASNYADKLIIVYGTGGSTANVSYHEKTNGSWQEIFSVNGQVGQNGFGEGIEGLRDTPCGTYSLGIRFGIYDNPGSKLEYTKITPDDYWVDDPNSKYYNQWVNTNEISPDWNSAEHLIDYPGYYNYCIAINFNTECIPGNGSAIFLHCTNYDYTYGCVSIPEEYMKTLIQQTDNKTYIVISPDYNSLNLW